MKKKYIAPESRLIVINLNEGIAAVSGGISEVSGSAVIKFTHDLDGCRGYYTGVMSAKVQTPGTSFMEYYDERIASRIADKETSVFIYLTGKDLRLLK